jgi:hypothetical protein
MALAPDFVLWAFAGGAFLLVFAGSAWLVWPEWLEAIFRRLWMADGVAAWLASALTHFLVLTTGGGHPRALGDPLAWRALGAGLAIWCALRVVPSPLRRPAVLLGLALALWAWAIGAGYVFLAGMEADATRLREFPDAVLAPAPGEPMPLSRAALFARLNPETRSLLDQVLERLGRGEPLEPGLRAAARERLVAPLREHYARDLARLRVYQWLQIGLLATVLLAWGFGERIARN